MGSCCTTGVNMAGENFVRELLKNESLTFRSYDYMELLNAIVTKRVEQEIPVKHIREYLIPEIYDEDQAKSNDIYFKSIFEHIISHLETNSNMYIVLFYFYPFINHKKEITYENLFNCLRFMTKSTEQKIQTEKVVEWLKKYIYFCTNGINEAVLKNLPPGDDITNSLESLNSRVYNKENIDIFVNELKNILTKSDSNKKFVTDEDFKSMLNNYDISGIEEVRDYLLKGY